MEQIEDVLQLFTSLVPTGGACFRIDQLGTMLQLCSTLKTTGGTVFPTSLTEAML